MLQLKRKLCAGCLKIRDRRPIAGSEPGEMEEIVHTLEATDPNLYTPKQYYDEDYVLEKHGAIMEKV